MLFRYLVVAGICLAVSHASAQERPFPQHLKYPYGFIPATITDLQVRNEFIRWKSALVTECSGGYRVECDNSGAETKVEAIGFGMLTAAIFGDKDLFDGLYKFYKSKLAGGGMMGWKVTCDAISDQSSATDGDVEVAFALIMASWQWPATSYLTDAKTVIGNLKKVVVTCGNLKALAMGYGNSGVYGGCNETDISYYNPAAFRLFAKACGNATDSAMWIKLAADTYTILKAGANSTTGLVPERQSTGGQPGSGDYGSYKYDACRTPWRIAMDYVWNGNKEAEAWLKKISAWAYGFGISKIKEGFTLSGSVLGTYHPVCFVGGFGIAAMAGSQAMVDEFGTDMAKIRDLNWFPQSLSPLYLALITGNQFRNDITEKRSDVGIVAGPAAYVNNAWPTVRCAGDRISISELAAGHAITVTMLSGVRVARLSGGNGATAVITTGALKRGCYVISLTDAAGHALETRTIAVY